MLFRIQVENPNNISIPLSEIGWDLFINSNAFVRGTIRSNQSMQARGATIVEIPVNLDYIDLLSTFVSLFGNRQVNYGVALSPRFSIPILRDMAFRIEHEGQVPLPQLPRVSMPSMSIDRLELNGAEILVTLNVENPNIFSLPPPVINFEYLVNGNRFINSVMETTEPLGPSSTTPIAFRFPVRFADLFRVFMNLQNLRDVPTQLNLTYDFGIPAFLGSIPGHQITGRLPLR